MAHYEFAKSPTSDLTALKQQYLQQLTAPLDGMWEVFAKLSDHYSIIFEDKIVGYCAVNAEQKLLQFHVEEGQDAHLIFDQLLNEKEITGAVIATNDHRTLSLGMDRQVSTSVNALMYQIATSRPKASVEFPAGSSFKIVEAVELQIVIDFAAETLGADRGWLKGYFGDLIEKGHLFALWQDGAVIATGECRVSATQKPYADVGMVVSKNHRSQGLATNILRQLAQHCHEDGLTAICSTEQGNIAAQKAIAAAGFVSHHRILELSF